jgi:Flp pilus assembly secretin CpaC
MRLTAAVLVAALAASGASAGQIWLTMDQVRPYEIAAEAGQIVVGNPAIADVTVQDKKRVLLFGKAPGLTNMYIFDDEGNAIENLVIRVKTNDEAMLTMHRGAQRVTYNCTTKCDPTLTVGDSNVAFGEVSSQVQTKAQQAGQAAPSGN